MKVLCGTDFSESAKEAAEVAAYAAARLKAPLTLVHCIADWLAPMDAPAPCHLEAQAQDLLNAEADRICAPGQRVELKLFHGSASHHLTAAAANSDTGLVVMGATGKGTVGRLLVGSVAEHVAETVSAPVLVIRKAEPLRKWLVHGVPLKVLCASDISESEEALRMAITELVLLGPIHLECAHVVETDAILLQSSAWALEQPEFAIPTQDELNVIQSQVKQRFSEAVGVSPSAVHVRQAIGNPAYDLVTLAHEEQADLILVGSHHKHGLQRVKHPSFSRRVLAHADTNILCVHLGTADLRARVSINLKKPAKVTSAAAE
ncbi:MAG TPA: universal stress protein [Candidatus Saccharimonadia bacterium]|nr:universal stress protein [Candidatus Saccharimonadia bacterium]